MLGYLRRLATTGFAYTASSILSKLFAVALLPVYTRALTPADYGAAEVMFAAVVATSIVVRFGVIEALLRYYYRPDVDSAGVVATGFAAVAWTATVAAAIAIAFAGPVSEVLLGRPDAALARIAIGGLWVFTLYEYLVTLFRLDERARAYFTFTFANVVAAIPLTVWLVIGRDLGADGLLLGSYGAAVPFLAWLLVSERRRLTLIPDVPLLRRMLRFGFPTMPAELSLYALNFIDRIALARLAGLAEAGLYALAFKFSQAITVLVHGFRLAWPPLAYSIQDDDEARRAYSMIVSWYVALTGFAVVGLWLLSRWITRWLAAPEFFGAYEAIGVLATGGALYGLYFVLLVVLGRTGRTEYNLPATGAAAAINVGLNIVLIPPLGIVGAGLALVAAYVVVLALMLLFTQRLFPVPYEWRRIGLAIGFAVAAVAIGDTALPDDGALGLISRAVLWAAYAPALWLAGFLHADERALLVRLLAPSEVLARLRQTRESDPEARPADRAEAVFEAEARDEDLR